MHKKNQSIQLPQANKPQQPQQKQSEKESEKEYAQ